MFKIDRKQVIITLSKYTSYAINIVIVASILGIVWFFIWGLMIAAK